MDVVRRVIAENCISDMARERVDSMALTTEYDSISLELSLTDEMVSILAGDAPFNLGGLSDVRPWLDQLRIDGTFIDVNELNSLRRALRTVAEVRTFFAAVDCPWANLKSLVIEMVDVIPVIRLIDTILTPTGEVKDNASPTLRDIRSRLSTIGNRISSTIRRVLARAVAEGIIDSDTTPAVRDGRQVLPVAAMNKRRISGIVHDESATGKTFFIEPAEVVELNNEQRELEIDERREIVRILTEVARQIRPELPALSTTFEIMGRLDFVRAKAIFATRIGGSRPELVNRSIIQWHDARHPVLRMTLETHGRDVVPLDIDLTDQTARILVVSGPNAGGKSVALKTVGIIQYMTQCGILPPLDRRSRMGIFDGIFVDIGDDQSMEDDLSTYSSHLRNMKFVLAHANNRSLVLIDEFGGGTEPQIGGAIAQALLTRFNELELWGVVTTHYQNLKQLAEETPGLVNGSMIYDRNRMTPTFRLAIGHPGSSFAIEIARKTGLPEDIIHAAEDIVGSDYVNLDKYLLDITRDRRYWENKRADIHRREKHLENVIARYEENAESLRTQRRAIIEEAKKQADEIIARSNAAIERTIHEIRLAEADKEQTRALRSQLAAERETIARDTTEEPGALKRAPRSKKKKTQSTLPKTIETIAEGDSVLLDNQGNPGTVIEINRSKATVAFGTIKITVPLTRLSKTIRQASSGRKDASFVSAVTVEASRQRQLDFKAEIDVRGMRADEAIQAVTYFIDDALQFNAKRVRILHGTGTGALRIAIRNYLDTVPGVRSFHDEDVRFGGAGITVVETD